MWFESKPCSQGSYSLTCIARLTVTVVIIYFLIVCVIGNAQHLNAYLYNNTSFTLLEYHDYLLGGCYMVLICT